MHHSQVQQSDFGTWHALSVPESSHFGPPGWVVTRMFREFLKEVFRRSFLYRFMSVQSTRILVYEYEESTRYLETSSSLENNKSRLQSSFTSARS
jgi:hypothetical protein